MAREGVCAVEGCPNTWIVARGWCRDHYYRWRWHGDPAAGRHNGEENREALFLAKVDKDGPVPPHRQELGPCWLWTGGRNPEGYGMFWPGKREAGKAKMVLAHRWSYARFVGTIPDGLSVLHSCDVPSCVNPDHLWLGTQLDNMRDCKAKGRHRVPRDSLGRLIRVRPPL